MRITLKIKLFEDPDEMIPGLERVKPYQFKSENVKYAEPSDLFPGCTTIWFEDDSVIEAVIPFEEFNIFVLPPDVQWFHQTNQ